jgi:hypothetical protein
LSIPTAPHQVTLPQHHLPLAQLSRPYQFAFLLRGFGNAEVILSTRFESVRPVLGLVLSPGVAGGQLDWRFGSCSVPLRSTDEAPKSCLGHLSVSILQLLRSLWSSINTAPQSIRPDRSPYHA